MQHIEDSYCDEGPFTLRTTDGSEADVVLQLISDDGLLYLGLLAPEACRIEVSWTYEICGIPGKETSAPFARTCELTSERGASFDIGRNISAIKFVGDDLARMEEAEFDGVEVWIPRLTVCRLSVPDR